MGVGSSSRHTASSVLRNCTLYKADRSPACRAVLMTLDAVNLSVNEVDVDMDKEEHKCPEISLMNPFQTLPILKDKGIILTDSHAISTYLLSKYARRSQLLPQSAREQALVTQMLHYDSGVLYPRYRAAAHPILYENCRYVMPHHISDIEHAYGELDGMLRRGWLTGAQARLADLAVAATVSTLDVMVPIDKTRYPRLSDWLCRISEEPFFVTANKKGLTEFAKRIDNGMAGECTEFRCPKTSGKRRRSADDDTVNLVARHAYAGVGVAKYSRCRVLDDPNIKVVHRNATGEAGNKTVLYS